MGKKPVYIHVGYGRTGTTWLQERVFSRAEELDYWGKNRDDFPQWLLEINYLDDQAFEARQQALANGIAERSRASRGTAVVSSEAFTNQGVITGQARRIERLFPNPHIILVLRDPIDLLESFYRMTVVRDGLWMDMEAALDWSRTPMALQKRAPIFLPDLFFDEVIEVYHKLFGPERVLVMHYETLVRSPSAYLERLGTFLGHDLSRFEEHADCRENPGPDPETVEQKRLENLNRTAERFSRPGRSLDAGLRQELLQYFTGKCSHYYEG